MVWSNDHIWACERVCYSIRCTNLKNQQNKVVATVSHLKSDEENETILSFSLPHSSHSFHSCISCERFHIANEWCKNSFDQRANELCTRSTQKNHTKYEIEIKIKITVPNAFQRNTFKKKATQQTIMCCKFYSLRLHEIKGYSNFNAKSLKLFSLVSFRRFIFLGWFICMCAFSEKKNRYCYWHSWIGLHKSNESIEMVGDVERSS